MRAVPQKTVIYTTAPKAYDWWFTTEVATNVGTTTTGKVVRKVEIESERENEQCDRYASGCHMAVDEIKWRKLVSFGLVTSK